MKKRTLMLIPVLSLASCNVNNNINTSYKDEEKYIVGNLETTDSVTQIKVNYILGKINFSYSDDSKVYVSETTSKEVSEDIQMRYYLNEGILNVQPCKPGRRNYSDAKRELDIKIPLSYSLSSITIDSVSSDINSSIEASEFKINTVSGSLKMSVDTFNKITCNVVSTDTEITVKGDIGVKVDFNSVSGKLTNNINTTDENHLIKYNTVSGDLVVNK